MQGAWVQSLVRELDPMCHNEDLVQPNLKKKKKLGVCCLAPFSLVGKKEKSQLKSKENVAKTYV